MTYDPHVYPFFVCFIVNKTWFIKTNLRIFTQNECFTLGCSRMTNSSRRFGNTQSWKVTVVCLLCWNMFKDAGCFSVPAPPLRLTHCVTRTKPPPPLKNELVSASWPSLAKSWIQRMHWFIFIHGRDIHINCSICTDFPDDLDLQIIFSASSCKSVEIYEDLLLLAV